MTARGDLLDEAKSLVDGDRNAAYGDPRQDFARTAAYWNVHLKGVLERKMSERSETTLDAFPMLDQILSDLFDPWDVAIMVDLVKTSRLAWSPHKRDNWTDKAGYSACGWHCAAPTDSAPHGITSPPFYAAMIGTNHTGRNHTELDTH